MLLSIIVPTLNEAQTLPSLLNQVTRLSELALETIIADGGSNDQTVEFARQFDCRIIQTAKGRARQMNEGAQKARGDYLLFLHADTRLADTTQFCSAIQWFIQIDDGKNAGHFGLHFGDASEDKKYEYWERKTLLNRPRVINGDQGLLISRKFFEQLKGFDERLPFMEDQEISRRIFQFGEWVTLPARLITSPRRFEKEGLARRMLLSAMIVTLYEIELWEFFERAPEIYREQDQTRKLQLTPFFRLAWQLQKEKGFRESLRLWYRVGITAQPESWQIGHFLDWKFNFKRARPITSFFDKVFVPITRNPPAYVLAALLVAVFYLSSWSIFTIRD